MGNGVHNVKRTVKRNLGKKGNNRTRNQRRVGVFDFSNLEEETKMQTVRIKNRSFQLAQGMKYLGIPSPSSSAV